MVVFASSGLPLYRAATCGRAERREVHENFRAEWNDGIALHRTAVATARDAGNMASHAGM